ncbi:MAG: stage II sporulation protein M [Candidatus Bathyarchaeia archaeon]
MSYCHKCGIKLPDEEGIKFCPNCGTPLPHTIIVRKKKETVFQRHRIIAFLIVFALCVIATVIGASTQLSSQDAQQINREMRELEEAVKGSNPQFASRFIFGNNFMHTLIMFIPVVGPCWGFFVLYNTGVAIAAISTINNINPMFSLFSLFLFPFTWMEYVSYALAISESCILTYFLFKRKLRDEITKMAIMVVVCSVILLLAAIIETAFISLII